MALQRSTAGAPLRALLGRAVRTSIRCRLRSVSLSSQRRVAVVAARWFTRTAYKHVERSAHVPRSPTPVSQNRRLAEGKMRRDDALTAGPPGKRSSVKRKENVNWRTICGANITLSGPALWARLSESSIEKKTHTRHKLQSPSPSNFTLTTGAAVCYR